MNRLIFFACLFFALNINAAVWIPSSEVNMTINWSSWDSGQNTAPSYLLGGSYMRTYFALMYNDRTNHVMPNGAAGSSWGNDVTNNLYSFSWPLWNSWKVAGYDAFMATGNGGYTDTNTIVSIGTNVALAPALMFNGHTYTNDTAGIVAITPLFTGDPESGVDSSNRDFGCQMLNTKYGNLMTGTIFPQVSANPGWFNITNFYAGGHPHPGESLAWAIYTLRNMNVETNVGTLTYNWGTATAYTNNWASSGPTVIGGVLADTIRPTRTPMAWDVPDGTITNDARSAFVIEPALANAFNWILQVTNLPVGSYQIAFGTSNIIILTDVQLKAGWNMFTNDSGPFWAVRKATLNAERDVNGADHVSLVTHAAGTHLGDLVNYGSDANGFYTAGNRGSIYLGLLATDVANVNGKLALMHDAAQPTAVALTITQISFSGVPMPWIH